MTAPTANVRNPGPGPGTEAGTGTDPDPRAQDQADQHPERPVDCSVVIPSYNGRRLLETVLASIERHLPDPDRLRVEVIVVDDASTDDSLEWLARRHPRVRVVARERNGGFCLAANAGVAASRGRVVQLLNNDTEVAPGWIEAGLEPFQDPAVGAVAPLVLNRRDPARVDAAGDEYSLVGLPYNRGHGAPSALWRQHPPDQVLGASASSAFYRGDLLRALGGFNPDYGSYYEDVELAFKIRWAGYICVFQPRCVVLHDGHASYDHSRPALVRQMERNNERLFLTCPPLSWILRGALPRIGFLAFRSLHLLRSRRARALAPILLGRLDALRQPLRLWKTRRAILALARSAPRPPQFPPCELAPFREFQPWKHYRPEDYLPWNHLDQSLETQPQNAPATNRQTPKHAPARA